MSQVEFRVDWLAVTVWGSQNEGEELWEKHLSKYLGSLSPVGWGGRGFGGRSEALASSKLYHSPVNGGNYVQIELPGKACESLPPQVMQDLLLDLAEHEDHRRFRVTRLDLAWDHVSFTPHDFLEAVEKNAIRTLAKRKTLTVNASPFDENDVGELGTMTVRLGSRTSSRSIRVYDKRGFTRVELETRHERADEIARLLLVFLPQEWGEMAVGHLRDYIDVHENEEKDALMPWWEELVMGIVRANLTVSDAKDMELLRLQKWFVHQVSPALSVLMDTMGDSVLDSFIAFGRYKRGDRYDVLLNNISPTGVIDLVQKPLAI